MIDEPRPITSQVVASLEALEELDDGDGRGRAAAGRPNEVILGGWEAAEEAKRRDSASTSDAKRRSVLEFPLP